MIPMLNAQPPVQTFNLVSTIQTSLLANTIPMLNLASITPMLNLASMILMPALNLQQMILFYRQKGLPKRKLCYVGLASRRSEIFVHYNEELNLKAGVMLNCETSCACSA